MSGYKVGWFDRHGAHETRRNYTTLGAACRARDWIMQHKRASEAWLLHVVGGHSFTKLADRYDRRRA